MPCDTITTVTLELKDANIEWLKAGLLSLKVRESSIYTDSNGVLRWQNSGSYDVRNGKLTSFSTEHAEAIKRAYSIQLVQKTMAKGGWRVKQEFKTEVSI